MLYYLSQNADFADSVKPLMAQLKDSEKMLSFLKDLSSFTDLFSTFKQESCKKENNQSEKTEDNKNPQSPTQGIADEFIQNILDSYLKKS